ncbi:MAG: hypothetical protein O2U61_02895 [Candidatus Bathyarchaeota archaeon]|nr:hypothetical protein [Candidatus Bathyarchaeota archaeon]
MNMKTSSIPQFRFFRNFNSESIAARRVFTHNISPSLLNAVLLALRDGYITLLFTSGRNPRYKLIVSCESLSGEHRQVFDALPLLRQVCLEYSE